SMRLGIHFLLVGTVILAADAPLVQGQQKPKELQWTHAFDLAARRFNELDFTKDTQKFGVEAFKDSNNGMGLYISQVGSLAAASARVKSAAGSDKKPRWTHSVDLRVRKGGVKDWKEAAKFGIEVYRDNTTGNLIYISETGAVAVIPDVAGSKAGAEGKAPEW